ncbi:MAG: hypothetical protein ACKOU7_06705, partial [Ferruginibacter sp.]
MYRLLILLHFFLATICTATAQTVAEYHVQQYTTDNGLPSNGIKGLQWDEKTGFLWMATEAGIVRFNGVDFKSYTKENMPSIGSERMLFIARNHAGNIYTADQPGNIFLIDKSRPVLWRATKIKSNYNNYLRNYYLLGVSDTFFNKLINSEPTASFSNGGDKIIPFSDTACFILNGGNLFYQSISFNRAQLLPFEKGTVSNFFRIGNRCFIISNKKDIFLLNPADFSVTPVYFAAAGLDIVKTKNNSNLLYWQNGMNNPVFIDDEKAWLLTYNGNTISATLIFSGIPPDSYIKSVQYSEKNRLLFIGTESKGLIVINQNRVQSKKRNDINSKNRNSYYSQIELADGSILTNESDIIGDHIGAKPELPIQGKFSFNITHTGEDQLWFSQTNAPFSYTCLHQYNKITGKTKVYTEIKGENIVAASAHEIYLANPNCIGVLRADSLLPLFTYPKSMAGTNVFDFTEISPGVLAIASCAGLFSFNTINNKFDTLFTQGNICVRNIWKYNDYVFFGTYG